MVDFLSEINETTATARAVIKKNEDAALDLERTIMSKKTEDQLSKFNIENIKDTIRAAAAKGENRIYLNIYSFEDHRPQWSEQVEDKLKHIASELGLEIVITDDVLPSSGSDPLFPNTVYSSQAYLKWL
jgi:hypothetical protein